MLTVVQLACSWHVCHRLLAIVVTEDALGRLLFRIRILLVVFVISARAHVLEVNLHNFLVNSMNLLERYELVDEALDQIYVHGEALLIVRPAFMMEELLLLEQVVLLLQLREGLDHLLDSLPVTALHLLLNWVLVLVQVPILFAPNAKLELVHQSLDVFVEFEAHNVGDHTLLEECRAFCQLLGLLLNLDLEVRDSVELLLVVPLLDLDFFELLEKSVIISILFHIFLLLVLDELLQIFYFSAELAHDGYDVVPGEAVAALHADACRNIVKHFAYLLPFDMHFLCPWLSAAVVLAVATCARLDSGVVQD